MNPQFTRTIPTYLVLVACGLVIGQATSCTDQNRDVEQFSELSGVFHIAGKSVERYYILLDGTEQRCNLRGESLKNLRDGTRVHVKGFLQSCLFEHTAGSEVAPPPFRKGWVIYLDVKEIRIIGT